MCASSLIQARARNVASDAIAGKGNQARCRCTLALSPPKKQAKKKMLRAVNDWSPQFERTAGGTFCFLFLCLGQYWIHQWRKMRAWVHTNFPFCGSTHGSRHCTMRRCAQSRIICGCLHERTHNCDTLWNVMNGQLRNILRRCHSVGSQLAGFANLCHRWYACRWRFNDTTYNLRLD